MAFGHCRFALESFPSMLCWILAIVLLLVQIYWLAYGLRLRNLWWYWWEFLKSGFPVCFCGSIGISGNWVHLAYCLSRWLCNSAYCQCHTVSYSHWSRYLCSTSRLCFHSHIFWSVLHRLGRSGCRARFIHSGAAGRPVTGFSPSRGGPSPFLVTRCDIAVKPTCTSNPFFASSTPVPWRFSTPTRNGWEYAWWGRGGIVRGFVAG